VPELLPPFSSIPLLFLLVLPLSRVQSETTMRAGFWMMAVAIVSVTASVLLLSAAGIYAMLSFTVARRWREIE
jgi:hypothetical protein